MKFRAAHPYSQWTIDNSGIEPVSNDSDNRHISDVLASGQERRAVLKSGLGLVASLYFANGLTGCDLSKTQAQQHKGGALLGFEGIASSRADTISVPEGYQANVFAPWGSPLNGVSPAYRADGGNTAAEQEQQKGSHHDGMHFFPIDCRTGGESSSEGLLVMNHEYVDANIMHSNGPTLGSQRPAEEVYKEMAAHGVSIQHIKRDANGDWRAVSESPYHRRITGTSTMDIYGPVRGSSKCKTAFSPSGEQTRGTFNNCSHGVTPWHTYLAAEENWAGYFVNFDSSLPREHRRYGVSSRHSRYHWERAQPQASISLRFDASNRAPTAQQDFRNEPNTFGWMVEIDPFNPDSVPRKRTALGRFAHEGVIFAKVEEGKPVVCYSGDDSRFEYIYKFVSAEPYHAETAGGHLLDHGVLYVARFNDDGSGQWLALDINDPSFQQQAQAANVPFSDQADLLINARLAADVAGATKMDRPEWGAIHPETGDVYFTLTNNRERTADQVNAANPRANNTGGHIIRWRETDGDPAAKNFSWDIFLLAGEADKSTEDSPYATESQVTLNESNQLASPDGLWFDKRGVLWIQTDMSGYQRSDGPFGNNQMFAVDPASGEARRFLVGPSECEVTGVVSTPDLKTLFVNIQHPGEKSKPGAFTSHWPDGGRLRPRSATVIITKRDGGIIGS